MKTSLFDYHLPKELIAQEPVTPRDSSKLMVVDRKRKTIEHKVFKDIGNLLQKGDLLVVNNAKVFPARLLGKKESTGGKVNLLLIEEAENYNGIPRVVSHNLWKCLAQGSGKIRKGLNMVFGNGRLKGVIKDYQKGIYWVKFDHEGELTNILEEIGEIPLPPYIKRASVSSKKRYQTIYAKKTGAIAAPTAGLHFTKKLLETLKEKGLSVATLTLIVGKGTFTPVKSKDVEKHQMDEEYFELNEKERKKINRQLALNRDCSGSGLKNNGRIVAVGTTTVRTLESSYLPATKRQAGKNREISQNQGKTSLFIYPGYKFNVVDVLITNFHLPRSTPLLLTCAFAGRELILKAYKEAIDKSYRFYSFGDAMLIT